MAEFKEIVSKFKHCGLIMCKKEKLAQVGEEIKKLLEMYSDDIKKKETWFGHVFGQKDGWNLYAMKNIFVSYRIFDDFLFHLAEVFYNDNDVMILGHNDKEGFFWSDYPQPPYYVNNDKEVLNG